MLSSIILLIFNLLFLTPVHSLPQSAKRHPSDRPRKPYRHFREIYVFLMPVGFWGLGAASAPPCRRFSDTRPKTKFVWLTLTARLKFLDESTARRKR